MIEQLGDFRIIRKIAEGGMGIVYLAIQESLERRVAVKVLKKEFSSDENFVQRFKREARNAAALVHPNIIQIHYVGTEDDIHYFAMEYVDGTNLKDYVKKHVRLSVVESLDIIIKVADALRLADEADIIHRDIKPENIMITPENHVKVMDFGLAKCLTSHSADLTQAGKILGTVSYMAPEQGLGKAVDSRSDIYSLGTVFFELLCGRPPFHSEHPTSVIYMHIYEPPPPVRFYNKGVPDDLEKLVLRMMAKNAEKRPQSIGILLEELEQTRETCGLRISNACAEDSGNSPTIMQRAVRPDAPSCLIVDDDQDVAALCQRILGDMGYNVFVAHDGVEALGLWQTVKPDVILLDLNMPRLNGMAVLEERREEKLGGTVYIMSARSDWKTIHRVTEQEVNGYILKPFTPDDLRKRIGPVQTKSPD